jgi:hypothetical protein
MLGHDYMRRHNEALRCIHLQICNNYGITNNRRIKSHSVQTRIINERVEVQVDTRIATNTNVKYNKPDIFIFDKLKREITIVEVGITSRHKSGRVGEAEEIISNTTGSVYRCDTRIIPYVMTWDGIVTTHHKRHLKELGISTSTEAYIQSRVLKMTLESISYDFRRGQHEGESPETEIAMEKEERTLQITNEIQA